MKEINGPQLILQNPDSQALQKANISDVVPLLDSPPYVVLDLYGSLVEMLHTVRKKPLELPANALQSIRVPSPGTPTRGPKALPPLPNKSKLATSVASPVSVLRSPASKKASPPRRVMFQLENDNNVQIVEPAEAVPDRILDAVRRSYKDPHTNSKSNQWYVRFGWKGYPDEDCEGIWFWLHEEGTDEETKRQSMEDWQKRNGGKRNASKTRLPAPTTPSDDSGSNSPTRRALINIQKRGRQRRLADANAK